MTALAAIWLFLTAAMKLRLVRWSLYLVIATAAFKTGIVAEYVCEPTDPVFQQASFLAPPPFTD